VVGAALAIHALVSLILLSSAVAHCLPRISHYQVDSHHEVDAGLHHQGGHHDHASRDPASPDPQDRQDDCCGILCRAAGHALAPALDLTRASLLSFAAQAAPPPNERPIPAQRWSLLPLGSRAPPIAA
jgi:hypothetical protein